MKYILCIESFIYYSCMIFIINQLFQKLTKLKLIAISYVVLFAYFLVSLHFADNAFYLFFPFTVIMIVVLAKLSSKHVKLTTSASIFLVLFSVNTILISIITSLIPQLTLYELLIDVLINLISACGCFILCMSDYKYVLQKLILQTPIITKRVFFGILSAEAILITIFLESSYFPSHDLWYRFVQIALILFTVALTIVLPILISTSIANNTLKQLTRQYEQQIAAQAEHYKHLAASQAELRRFRHDFHNTRVAVETLLRQGDTDGALALLTDDRDALCAAALPFDTGNGIADALLTDKQQRAASSGITLTFDGLLPSEGLSPADICILLGNTLDNAIEACEALPISRDRRITVTAHGSNGFLFLSVTNPVAAKVAIEHDRIPTTKADKTLHGFGLQSLHAAAKRYNGRVVLSCTDELFTADIDLCLMPSVSQTASLSLR